MLTSLFSLFLPGSILSSEPMYILMNTAISSQWGESCSSLLGFTLLSLYQSYLPVHTQLVGFPNEGPPDCPCKDYDCHAMAWQSKCGFSDGFCDMMMNVTNLPKYKINWVRVYQDPNDELQKVGCSTPERPTRKYIEAHEEIYKLSSDVSWTIFSLVTKCLVKLRVFIPTVSLPCVPKKKQAHPLKEIQVGHGPCVPGATGESPDACGGLKRGRCTNRKVCECLDGWVGPNCLAHNGFNPIEYDVPDNLTDLGFRAPAVAPVALIVGFGLLVLIFLVTPIIWRERLDGYKPIP